MRKIKRSDLSISRWALPSLRCDLSIELALSNLRVTCRKAVDPLAEFNAARQPEPALLHFDEVISQRGAVGIGSGFIGANLRVLLTFADLLTQTVQHNATLPPLYPALRR